MLRIGMIGSENSHSKAVSKLINVDKAVRGAKVTVVWGEKKVWAKETAEAGQIPAIVDNIEDMVGQVDGVMVDHRHGKYHLPAAAPFIDAKVPVFVDKPLCCSLKEGIAFLANAKKKKVPVTSFSSIPTQAAFQAFKKEVEALGGAKVLVSSGPVDLKSKYGGIFFYGIHQVDAVLDIFGIDVTHAEVRKHKDGGVGVLYYPDGRMATMNLVKGGATFNFLAYGAKGVLFSQPARDANPYLASTKTWLKMMRTGQEPIEHRRMLAPVAVLEAMDKSLKNRGKKVKVGAF